MRPMINLETRPKNEENTLASMASLYPLAFAMAVASNSRAGLALRRFEITVLNAPRAWVDWSFKAFPAISAGCPLPSAPLV